MESLKSELLKDVPQETDQGLVHGTEGPGNNSGKLSRKAQKRLSRIQRHKELKKQKRAKSLLLAQNDDAGYRCEDFNQTSYYFENGLRKVNPYNYVFATHAKGRWVGRKLHDVLENEFGYDHPNELDNAFTDGKIHVNNRQVSADYVVKDCDYIAHRTHRHENSVTAAPIEVIHDSEDVVVINKPSSMPCHPCGRYRFNSVVFIMGKEMGYTNLRNIYRLDRLTSGVLVLGKTTKHTKVLEDQVMSRQVQKEYVCRVVGKFPDGRVVVDQPLKALSNKLRLQVVSPSGKLSRTNFERISYNGTSSVVKCWPETGRTHQIRVHLQYLGHPIINDGFYNSPAWGPNRAKGGLYEVQHQQVCEKILAEHHVNLWDGGENPLYTQKLKETQERQDVTSRSDLSSQTSDQGQQGAADTDEPQMKKRKVNKILKADGNTDANRENNISSTCDTGLEKSVQHEPEASQKLDSQRPVTSVETASETVEQCVSTVTKQSLSTCMSESNCVSLRSVKDQSISVTSSAVEKAHGSSIGSISSSGDDVRANMTLEQLDLSCEMCKRQAIDPAPKRLVMFLHALKYKGVGWEFETPLPDWAHEDWNQELDFML